MFIPVNDQILKNNLAIWSHCEPISWPVNEFQVSSIEDYSNCRFHCFKKCIFLKFNPQICPPYQFRFTFLEFVIINEITIVLINTYKVVFKWAIRGQFYSYSQSFQSIITIFTTNNTIFTKNKCEKCPSSKWILTHDIQNTSLLPYHLNSAPAPFCFVT